MKYDEEPIFDKEYLVTNVPNISFPTEQGRRTTIFMLDEEGKPCRRQYLNGKLFDDLKFVDFESLQIYANNMRTLYDEFCDYMKEYEKEFAKIIRITKKI